MTMRMTIDVTYRVVTPLFCAGVDRKKGPELRLPSFKGVLRYWWRALAWSRYDGDLAVLRQREDRLFGSADAGQSRILLRLIPATETGDGCERRRAERSPHRAARRLATAPAISATDSWRPSQAAGRKQEQASFSARVSVRRSTRRSTSPFRCGSGVWATANWGH